MYTVVLPSTGRVTLNSAVESIYLDAVTATIPVKIVVALNGRLRDCRLREGVEVHHLAERPIGVSAALNQILPKQPPGLAWLFADDDLWLPGKFAHDIAEMAANPAGLLLPRVFLVDELGAVERPQRTIEKETIEEYLYGSMSLRRNGAYISLSGACASIDTWRLARFPTMTAREDVTFLMDLEAQGVKFRHAHTVTVCLNVELNRGALRDTPEAALSWASASLSTRNIPNFIGGAWAKPHVVAGRSGPLVAMARLLIKASSVTAWSRAKALCLLIIWLGFIPMFKTYGLVRRALTLRNAKLRA